VPGYWFKNYFDDMDAILTDIYLIQMVKFLMWSGTINGNNKILYLSTILNSLFSVNSVIGDHLQFVIDVLGKSRLTSYTLTRNWKYYSVEEVDWNIYCDNVQDY
jgi:hypothetical protein